MLAHIAQPLVYAESLLAQFGQLSRQANTDDLAAGLVQAAAQLGDCELSQLYLLDSTHTRLTLAAQWLEGQVSPEHSASLPSDYDGGQLLQYCLCQNRHLSLASLDPSLHETSFLPASPRPWRSLLCLPLQDEQGHVAGLLLLASHSARELAGFAGSLASLGTFALTQHQLLQRLRAPQLSPAPASVPSSGYGLIGNSAAMRAVYQLLGKVLHNPTSVLLTGETGTGKELVARAIHDCGFRRSQAFIVQNCASLPENLLESELFGYRKGAFTGAERDRKGLFDAADGGTLFLDEIGDMPLALQAKLLRVLQEGEVRPLGSTATHKVDVRIVAATHRDLRSLVEQGRFREDLFYRLSHFPIALPALRERDEDILLLARHFAAKASAFLQRDPCRWAETTLTHLAGYAFPGNVRELKGLVERAVLLCEGGELLPEHFNLRQDASQPGDGCMNLRERLERVERNLLLDCLRKNRGNQSQAARELGLPRRTLLYRMDRLNISPADV
ncbi:sigma-54-dependent Fis family transcriptional regulator [Pseudomonas alcaligenes]|uniref:Sigma-54-dependent Fis family transcriptional regulator n=1 Tax=Aquipseudomonas alcaligenes TaxID=43263 RepID=A0ABR7RWG2_AQUAC|nr:sigma 54-interacting transcriptional regulator [Pseudomonas alcaligenes]MBC9248656.1 sigma-54-dependent Fis family transcriptional regulator [Pseudomonas alcaligenes]